MKISRLGVQHKAATSGGGIHFEHIRLDYSGLKREGKRKYDIGKCRREREREGEEKK